jgi:hypothetical protein
MPRLNGWRTRVFSRAGHSELAVKEAATLSTDQILGGLGLIVVLAVGSQVLASQLRVPALIILLPVGFTAGAITGDVNPERLLGPAFHSLVSLAVAVILYTAGLGLSLRNMAREGVVRRLIALGVPITWGFAAGLAAVLLGMSSGAAIMLGAILVVSGPTVVNPLLRFVRPTEHLSRILDWEGSTRSAVSSAPSCSLPWQYAAAWVMTSDGSCCRFSPVSAVRRSASPCCGSAWSSSRWENSSRPSRSSRAS